MRGITIWRIVDGKIREEWTSMDQLTAYRQAAAQLKWMLLGMFLAAVILLWAFYRATLRLWPARIAKASTVSS